MVHPDKCKHPQAQEAFGVVIFFMGFELLIYCTELLLNDQERDYILTRVHAAKG
ncbi:hypothetical protein DY000_02000967 [Brassica cretica]|uniref:J domain-containing protein n=1 Tax=Brassica cretica TaxID=69181 RepID=A0ABQ7C3Y0_BRACR|nr:hypothetical protein DY000_02000967 [Brassica cretica]